MGTRFTPFPQYARTTDRSQHHQLQRDHQCIGKGSAMAGCSAVVQIYGRGWHPTRRGELQQQHLWLQPCWAVANRLELLWGDATEDSFTRCFDELVDAVSCHFSITSLILLRTILNSKNSFFLVWLHTSLIRTRSKRFFTSWNHGWYSVGNLERNQGDVVWERRCGVSSDGYQGSN